MTLLYPRPTYVAKLDTTHPAASGMSGNHGLAAVVIGSTMTNLINNQAGTVSGGTFSTIDIGDVWNTSQGGTSQTTFTGTTTQDLVCTLAAIIEPNNINRGAIIFSDSSDTGGFSFELVGAAPNNFNLVLPNVIVIDSSTVAIDTTTAWFVAVSYDGANANFLALNMTTGATQTQTVASAHTPGAPSVAQTTVGSLGGAGAAGNIGGATAVAAFSPTALTTTQLNTWASNPWGLWYATPAVTLMGQGCW